MESRRPLEKRLIALRLTYGLDVSRESTYMKLRARELSD